jgi:hypothetical protein
VKANRLMDLLGLKLRKLHEFVDDCHREEDLRKVSACLEIPKTVGAGGAERDPVLIPKVLQLSD